MGKVESGTALVNESGRTLERIVASVRELTSIVDEIAVASNEQATGIEQVGIAVSQMDDVIQSNASQTEELARTAEALSDEAAHLESLVHRFQLAHAA